MASRLFRRFRGRLDEQRAMLATVRERVQAMTDEQFEAFASSAPSLSAEKSLRAMRAGREVRVRPAEA